MIIAGIFKPDNKNYSVELKNIMKEKIKGDFVFFENKTVSIIAGKTSETVDQGKVLKTHHSLLVGKVFTKDTYKAITEEGFREEKSDSKLFVNKYWGKYILFNIDDENETLTILRDPIGQLPLFYIKLDSGAILFSSEINVLHTILKKKPDFNWNYFSAYILHTSITSEQTAFNHIYELPHGCQLLLGGVDNNIEISTAWNPLDYCHSQKNPQQIQKNIIETLRNVIKCWTNNTEGVFLDFSGGTDSTGLLLVLKEVLKKDQVLKAVNSYHAEIPSSDERKHALAIAQEVGVDFIEFDRSKNLNFEPIAEDKAFKPNWPGSHLAVLKAQQDVDSLAKDYKNIVYISGHGGDHIFVHSPPVESLCDYLIEQQGKGLYAKIKAFSTLYRKPLFPIIKGIIKSCYRYYFGCHFKRSFSLQSKLNEAPLFSKEVRQREKRMRYHPFFYQKRARKIMPGKFRHITAIYNGLSTIKKDIRDKNTNPVFYPLFSQPLIELALSIPTYESLQEGYSRYHFRKAVSDAFKTNVVWRQDKGETSGIIQKALKKNENHVLDICLNGNFKESLIDKKILPKMVKGMIYGQTENDWAIINLFSLEIFLRHWDINK